MKNISPLYKFSLKGGGWDEQGQPKMQPPAEIVRVVCARNPLRRSCVSSARNAGESAICPMPAQPSAEIVRVECAQCRRVRFVPCPRNPLRRSRVSSARNAGESAIWGAGS